MIEFGSQPTVAGLKFSDGESEFEVAVHDKFPQMGEVHIEGRRYVEVSVEMFVALMDAVGFQPVAPEADDE